LLIQDFEFVYEDMTQVTGLLVANVRIFGDSLQSEIHALFFG
jgi:hypothetical protein